MHRATQVLLCVVCLLLGAALYRDHPPTVHAQDAFHPSFSPLITHSQPVESGQQLTVIDATKRAMAVYHVDKATGRVTLKSVRQVHWDLQLEEFNGVSPLPREIQSLLSHR